MDADEDSDHTFIGLYICEKYLASAIHLSTHCCSCCSYEGDGSIADNVLLFASHNWLW